MRFGTESSLSRMMKSPFKTRQFIELKSRWYEKLQDEGFLDIENTRNGEDYIKCWHSYYFINRYKPTYFRIRQQYYRQISHFRFEHPFKSPLEESVWELHCEGVPMRKIAERVETTTWKVFEIVTTVRNALIQKLAQEESDSVSHP